MKEYIKTSSKRALSESREKLLHGKNVFISEELPADIDIDYVLKNIEETIPLHLMHLVDTIYVGSFPFLKEKEVNALYDEGALYVTNDQSDDDDMIDDIVHEIAHAVEDLFPDEIYSDQEVENEFLGKRKRMCSMLNSEGHRVSNDLCMEVEYNKEFDTFLYKDVGYEKLVNITMGLFNSPYGATSLKEYFANGFEAYYIGDRTYLSKISPYLYNKIENLDNLKDFI